MKYLKYSVVPKNMKTQMEKTSAN